MKNSVLTHSANETVELGKEFSSTLQGGDIIALYGDLGSGKTQFAKGICLGLGVHAHVVSPSFTILNEYVDGKYPVYHFDFYRLRSLSELAEFGFEEYIFGRGICLLEWANIVESALPPNRYDITLELGESENQRMIHFAKAANE